MVDNRFPLKGHFAPRGGLEKGQNPQQRGFPGAVRSEDREDLSRANRQVLNLQDRPVLVGDGEAAHSQNLVAHPAPPRCWTAVNPQLITKVIPSRMTLNAMAMSKFPFAVSRTVAVVRTRV